MTKISIINYGVGNFRNVQKAFQAIGANAEIIGLVTDVAAAEAIVLPGVGAFGDAINNLRERGLDRPVLDAVQVGKPLLGICVGLQLLFDESEEMGHHQGLGIMAGKVARFPQNLTVPHMGWNQIEPERDHPLLNNIDAGDFAYFAHSYYVQPDNPNDIIACTDYGRRYPSVVGQNNVCAIQFHPEKSQQVGLQILKNFVGFAERELKRLEQPCKFLQQSI